MDKILVSACFLGERVRYNGKVKALNNDLLAKWQLQGRLVLVCPEVLGGLSVPRAAAEIELQSSRVITQNKLDVTSAFNLGAQQALRLCQQHNIRFALLKESSPSCGSNTIYDGSFSQQKVAGEGITTKLLRAHGIKVFCEDNISELSKLLDVN